MCPQLAKAIRGGYKRKKKTKFYKYIYNLYILNEKSQKQSSLSHITRDMCFMGHHQFERNSLRKLHLEITKANLKLKCLKLSSPTNASTPATIASAADGIKHPILLCTNLFYLLPDCHRVVRFSKLLFFYIESHKKR